MAVIDADTHVIETDQRGATWNEIASQWVPWTLKDLARRLPQQRARTLPENPLEAYRLYVACQSDDDLPHVLTYTGQDNTMMGTDYEHHDHAADLEGLRNLKTAERDQRARLRQDRRRQPQGRLRVAAKTLDKARPGLTIAPTKGRAFLHASTADR